MPQQWKAAYKGPSGKKSQTCHQNKSFVRHFVIFLSVYAEQPLAGL